MSLKPDLNLMPKLSPIEIPILFLQLAVLYTSSKFFGKLVRKIGQPAVVGEIFAGIMVGPTALGTPSQNKVPS
jgi:Kef-type K+ transport system membrane component KefB